jgi:hypothetical protein
MIRAFDVPIVRLGEADGGIRLSPVGLKLAGCWRGEQLVRTLWMGCKNWVNSTVKETQKLEPMPRAALMVEGHLEVIGNWTIGLETPIWGIQQPVLGRKAPVPRLPIGETPDCHALLRLRELSLLCY